MRPGVPEYLKKRYRSDSGYGEAFSENPRITVAEIMRIGNLMEKLGAEGSIGGAKPDVAGIQRREKVLLSKPLKGTPLRTGREEIMDLVEKARAEAAGQLRRNPPIAKPSPKSGIAEDWEMTKALGKKALGDKEALEKVGKKFEAEGRESAAPVLEKTAAQIAREKEEERRRRRGY